MFSGVLTVILIFSGILKNIPMFSRTALRGRSGTFNVLILYFITITTRGERTSALIAPLPFAFSSPFFNDGHPYRRPSAYPVSRNAATTRKTVDEQLPPPPPPLFILLLQYCYYVRACVGARSVQFVFYTFPVGTHSLHTRVRRVTCVSVVTTPTDDEY